jgi:hypothetical protein
MTHDELPATLEEKLRLLSDLDERIAQSRAAEHRGLMRGAFLAVAMFGMMGVIPNYMDPVAFEIFRYGSCAVLLGAEFLIRRSGRRRLEMKQESLMGDR